MEEEVQQQEGPKAALILNYDGYTIVLGEGNNFVEGRDPDGRIMAVSRELFRHELYDLFTKYLYIPKPPVNADGSAA